MRNLFCRYSDFLLAQIMRSVACNSFHSIEQRAARWLLTAPACESHDRVEHFFDEMIGESGLGRWD